MSGLIAALIAAFPRALLAVLAPLVTEAFLASVLRRVIVAGLRRAARMTVTTVDDALVEDIARRLEPGEGAGHG